MTPLIRNRPAKCVTTLRASRKLENTPVTRDISGAPGTGSLSLGQAQPNFHVGNTGSNPVRDAIPAVPWSARAVGWAVWVRVGITVDKCRSIASRQWHDSRTVGLGLARTLSRRAVTVVGSSNVTIRRGSLKLWGRWRGRLPAARPRRHRHGGRIVGEERLRLGEIRPRPDHATAFRSSAPFLASASTLHSRGSNPQPPGNLGAL
jgi:hypothetical protein